MDEGYTWVAGPATLAFGASLTSKFLTDKQPGSLVIDNLF